MRTGDFRNGRKSCRPFAPTARSRPATLTPHPSQAIHGLALLGNAVDLYSFTLADNQTATLAVSGVGSAVELLDGGGTVLASGVAAENVSQVIINFRATSTGAYFVRVTRSSLGDYNLIVTRDATFDTENNDDADHAQELLAGRTGGALGSLTKPGLIEYNGHYYVLTSGSMLWPDAEAEAVSLGGHLATINDEAENLFLHNTYFNGPTFDDFYLVGFNDFAEEGNFVWSSGEPVTYTNWYPGEPNDYLGNEDGTVINWGHCCGWNDAQSDQSFIGIIESSGTIRTYPALSNTYVVDISNNSPTSTNNDFANFLKCDLGAIQSYSYLINGTTTVSDLTGNVHQRDQVQVQFRIKPGYSNVQITLVSYSGNADATLFDLLFTADDADWRPELI